MKIIHPDCLAVTWSPSFRTLPRCSSLHSVYLILVHSIVDEVNYSAHIGRAEEKAREVTFSFAISIDPIQLSPYHLKHFNSKPTGAGRGLDPCRRRCLGVEVPDTVLDVGKRWLSLHAARMTAIVLATCTQCAYVHCMRCSSWSLCFFG